MSQRQRGREPGRPQGYPGFSTWNWRAGLPTLSGPASRSRGHHAAKAAPRRPITSTVHPGERTNMQHATPSATAPARRSLVQVLYIQVLIAIALGVLLGYVAPDTRQVDEVARRRLHRAHQDDDRADHLLHHRARHRVDRRPEEGRPRRPQGADLFRGRVLARPARGRDRRRDRAAGRRFRRQSGAARRQGGGRLRQQGAGGFDGRPHHGDHSEKLLRCLRGRRPAPDPADRGADRRVITGSASAASRRSTPSRRRARSSSASSA